MSCDAVDSPSKSIPRPEFVACPWYFLYDDAVSVLVVLVSVLQLASPVLLLLPILS
jgi:hypothetical protein